MTTTFTMWQAKSNYYYYYFYHFILNPIFFTHSCYFTHSPQTNTLSFTSRSRQTVIYERPPDSVHIFPSNRHTETHFTSLRIIHSPRQDLTRDFHESPKINSKPFSSESSPSCSIPVQPTSAANPSSTIGCHNELTLQQWRRTE